MYLERITSEGLAHHSYYIADEGVALVCDPRRDVDVYLERARQRGETIRYVLETHRNEDYAIGSTALAELGAEVLHADAQQFEYGRGAGDGDSIELGRLRFDVMETFGHTRDSLSYAIADRSAGNDPFAVLTGDTLFVGDTGRIDLLGEREEAPLARALYYSVQRLLSLGDGVVILPAHGSGSVCGAGISHRDLSSIGVERATHELLSENLDNFVAAKRAEQHVRPPYFRLMEEWNLRGNAPILHRLPEPQWLGPGELADELASGTTVIDMRDAEAFAGGHIPDAINIWLEGLPSYLGWFAKPRARVAFVLPDQQDVETAVRMAVRLGYDDLAVLRDGFGSWRASGRPIGRFGTIDAAGLEQRTDSDAPVILDVRQPDEWEQDSVEDSVQIFVGDLPERIHEVPRNREIVTMCGVGNRASIAASILRRNGFSRVTNLLGGIHALRGD